MSLGMQRRIIVHFATWFFKNREGMELSPVAAKEKAEEETDKYMEYVRGLTVGEPEDD